MMLQEDTWIAQRRYAGQVEYYVINNPIETQILLNDVIKVLLYGYIRDTWNKLDTNAKPWYPFPGTQYSTKRDQENEQMYQKPVTKEATETNKDSNVEKPVQTSTAKVTPKKTT